MTAHIGRLGVAVATALVVVAATLGVLSARAAGDGPRWGLAFAAATVLLCAVAMVLMLRRERREVYRHEQQVSTERETTRMLGAVLGDTSDLVLVTDHLGTVTYASEASVRLLGSGPDALNGRRLTDLVSPSDHAKVIEGIKRLIGAGDDAELALSLQVRHADGSQRLLDCRVRNPSREHQLRGVVWDLRDVTEQRAIEAERSQRTLRDGLTGLPNRVLLLERLDRSLGRAERLGRVVGLAAVASDELKRVDEELGHAAGDEVVRAAAERLRDVLRPGDTLGRLGGGELVLLMEDLPDVASVVSVAHQTLDRLGDPFEASGRSLQLRWSAGLATSVTMEDQTGAEGVLRDARAALAHARSSSGTAFVVFDETMRRPGTEALDLSVDIRSAAPQGQIQVLYQPLIDLQRGALEGFEALARWHHPSRGLVPPMTFIPVAEDSGAIHDIGRHVLEVACRQAAMWIASTTAPLRVSVNVSPYQLATDNIVDHVRSALAASGLRAHSLILEMTENALVHDVASVARRLQALRVMGVRIAMDDFGTGYSSLAYLRRLPLDILKIDKSFVDDERGTGPLLLSSLIEMGRTLGLATVAEGIEDETQLGRARSAGCTYAQGYLIGRPMDGRSAAEFAKVRVRSDLYEAERLWTRTGA